MSKEEFRRLMKFHHAEKRARKFGMVSAKPDWSFAPKGYIKIEATGRMEMNKSRH